MKRESEENTMLIEFGIFKFIEFNNDTDYYNQTINHKHYKVEKVYSSSKNKKRKLVKIASYRH